MCPAGFRYEYERFCWIVSHTQTTLLARGFADIPELSCLMPYRGQDAIAVYLDLLMRHCYHIQSRCDEIAHLLADMLTMRDRLDSLEDEFDRVAGLIESEDFQISKHASRDYNNSLEEKIDLRSKLKGGYI